MLEYAGGSVLKDNISNLIVLFYFLFGTCNAKPSNGANYRIHLDSH